LFAGLVALVLLLTACQVDVRVGLVLEDDGTGDVTVGVGLDDEALERVPDLVDQLRTEDLEEAGWSVTGPEQEPDGLTWIRASKPFANPDQAAEILEEVAGPDGPFQDTEVSRSSSFGRTTFTVEGTADFSGGLAAFSDAQLVELLGDGFGGNLAEIEAETGAPAAEQVNVSFVAEVPGESPEVVELDPTSGEPQPIDVSTTSTRTDALILGGLAVIALLAAIALAVRAVARRRSVGDDGDELERRERADEALVAVGATAERVAAEHDVVTPQTPAVRPEPSPEVSRASEPVADTADALVAGDPPSSTPTSAAAATGATAAAAGAGSPRPPRRLGVVVLDAMGVVFDTGRDLPGLLAAFLRDQGINLPVDEVGARLAEATLGQVSPAEMWRSLGVDGGHDELTDQFLALQKPSPGLRAFLDRMQARELPVVVVANDIADWSHSLRDTHKLGDLTAGWIVSSELGHRLPDAAVYDEIVRVSGQDSRNTFFIAAELRFLAAARSYGFAAAWFNETPEPGDENAGYPLIESFRDFGLGP
jgi:FMN phosphatase YigB (HAD superfamily)